MLVNLYGASPDGPKGRYSPAECIGARKERITGTPDKKHVSTSALSTNLIGLGKSRGGIVGRGGVPTVIRSDLSTLRRRRAQLGVSSFRGCRLTNLFPNIRGQTPMA